MQDRRSTLRRLGALALAAALAHGATAQDPDGDAGLRPSDRELLAWFEGLGFPAPEGGDFGEVVRVVPDSRVDAASDRTERESVAWGFLLGEDDREIRIRSVALQEERIPRRVGGPKRPALASFERRDLVGELRRSLEPSKDDETRPPFDRSSFPLSGADALGTCAEWVVAASLAARHGEPVLARRLLTEAESEAARRDAQSPPSAGESPGLRGRLVEELSRISIWRMKLALDEPDSLRTDVLAEGRRIARVFPGTKHAEEAFRHAEVLARMVAEDEAHARDAKSWDAMSAEERVAELVFQLRDQDGAQFMQPGAPWLFEDRRGDASPARRLVALGAAAVPQLIDHLDDPQFTRTVGYWRNFTYSHYVVTVGEACADVLSEIAGRRFGTGWNERWSPERARSARAAVEEWWATFREGGERAAALAALRSDGAESRAALRKLVEIDRTLAVEEGLAAIGRTHGGTRDGLEQELQALADDPRVEAFFLRTAREGASRPSRVRAVGVLLRLGHPDALEPALELWRTDLLGTDVSGEEWFLQALFEFGGSECGAAVLASVESAGPRLRLRLLKAGTQWRPVVPREAGVRARLVDLLVGSLDDRTDTGTTWWSDGRTGSERVCDVAANWMAPVLEDGGRFVTTRPESERDADIVILREKWRAARGLPPTPPPPDRFPAVERAPDERTDGLLGRVLAGDADAVRETEELGLAALPAARERLAESPANDPATARLRELVSRLARIVRSADVVGGGEGRTALGDAVAATRGRPFDTEALVRLASEAAAAVAKKQAVAEIRVERPADADGLAVRVALLAGDPPRGDLRIETSVRTGGPREGHSYDVADTDHLHERQIAVLREDWGACESAPRDRPLEFVLRIVP